VATMAHRLVEEHQSLEVRCAELVKRNKTLEARVTWAHRQACLEDVLDQLPKLPAHAMHSAIRKGASLKHGKVIGCTAVMARWKKLADHLSREPLHASSMSAIPRISEGLTVRMMSRLLETEICPPYSTPSLVISGYRLADHNMLHR
jgi:hypothetical protein